MKKKERRGRKTTGVLKNVMQQDHRKGKERVQEEQHRTCSRGTDIIPVARRKQHEEDNWCFTAVLSDKNNTNKREKIPA